MTLKLRRGILSAAALILSAALMCGCSTASNSASDEEEEEEEDYTFSVEDDEYYSRYRGAGISINVYNWGENIAGSVNEEFTNLTGIKVNYTNYATNEELYAKLKGGGASYDVIIPSDYMISKMIYEDMLLPLDLDNIPNFGYIMDRFKNPVYDPENAYSVPYTWGTVGIIYNASLIDIPKDEIDWDILWNEDYLDQILMFDNPRDAFAIAETLLGYSMNTEDPIELTAAANKLKEQKQKHLVQGYVMDEIFDKMEAGDALLAPYYAGDALMILDSNEDLDFVVPKSGTNLFVDAMCIPKGARQKEAAEMYINFMCEPDVSYANIDYIQYSTPNSAAYELLDEDVRESPISYPDEERMENMTVFARLSEEAGAQMQELWTEIKSAEDENTNKWLVPVFLALCLAASIATLIIRHVKNKKDIF